MITRRTVLVLGAGASAPFGFPVGQRLKDIICESLNEIGVRKKLMRLEFEEQEIVDFMNTLRRSPVPSVDAFLERRTGFERVGKAAIALTLLPQERTDLLFEHWISKRKDPNNKEGNWYDQLFNALNTEFEKFDKNDLSIITFNYDRSLEHYLFTSLKHTYNKSDKECANKLQGIPIIHVHGSLGLLGWQDPSSIVGYDSNINTEVLKAAMQNIKIIHEDIEETEEFNNARKLLQDGERVYFLGFGYHPTNLRRLAVKLLNRNKGQDIQGTSLGLSIGARRLVNRLVYSAGTSPMRIFRMLHDCTVWEFFHKHVDLKNILSEISQ